MVCKKCANEVKDNAKFCDKCGSSIDNSEPVQVNPVTVSTTPAPTYATASVGQRFANYILDRVFSSIIIFILFFLIFFAVFQGNEKMIPWLMLLDVILALLYFIVPEYLWQKSFAKFITSTKVVMKDGSKPPLKNIIGRTFARIIPFEQLSYLFSAFPVGWHDRLSGTIVVPNSYSTEDVKKINFDGLKGNHEGNYVIMIVVIFFSFLFAVAIMGILSSVVLVSLNVARQKAADAGSRSAMTQVKIESLVYEQNENSFTGFCKNSKSLMALKTELIKTSRKNNSSYVCNDSESAWAVSVPMRSSGNYLCIDNSGGDVVQSKSRLGSSTTCSGGITSATKTVKDEDWIKYTSEKDKFEVMIPRNPTFKQDDNIPMDDGSDMTTGYHEYTSSDGQTSFFIFKYFYSDKLDISEPDEVLGSYLDSLVGYRKDNELISSSYGYDNGRRILDFVTTIENERVSGRFILVGETPYLLMMDYYPENYNENNYNRFINSFKLK